MNWVIIFTSNPDIAMDVFDGTIDCDFAEKGRGIRFFFECFFSRCFRVERKSLKIVKKNFMKQMDFDACFEPPGSEWIDRGFFR